MLGPGSQATSVPSKANKKYIYFLDCFHFFSLVDFHPIPIIPRVYMDPTNLSPNGTNIYFAPGQPFHGSSQPSSAAFPFYCTSPSPTQLTSWISASSTHSPPTHTPMHTPYFLVPNHQIPQNFPFQQLI